MRLTQRERGPVSCARRVSRTVRRSSSRHGAPRVPLDREAISVRGALIGPAAPRKSRADSTCAARTVDATSVEIAAIPGSTSAVGASQTLARLERVQAIERVERDTRFPAIPLFEPRVDRAEFSAEALAQLARELPCGPET